MSAVLRHVVYIGLGSNLGDSKKLLKEAIGRITEIRSVKVEAVSSVFYTEPQGDKEQPWFLNQVAKITCEVDAMSLLEELQKIEKSMGRVRTSRRFGPRYIDLDILLYGSAVIYMPPKLIVPHPRMHERAFVLIPLAQLEPQLKIPTGGDIQALLNRLDYSLNGDKIHQKM